MTYVLNGASAIPAADVTKRAGAGFWKRLYAALIESRRRSAMREMRAYAYLIDESRMVMGDSKSGKVSSDSALPFSR